MFVSPPPPPEPQRIAPAEEVRICPRYDPKCYIDMTNDVLKAFADLKSSASSLIDTSGGGVVVNPRTGRLQVTGRAPEVIVGPARAA